jgi:hypothetical protein
MTQRKESKNHEQMPETETEPDQQKLDNPKQTGFLIGGSLFLGLICLIGLASPDSNKLERDLRNEVKQGTQMKDVIAYIKDHGWTYDWNKDARSITTNIPGASWMPIIKPKYKKIFYFDDFNRLRSQNGNLEYGLH